MAIEIGGITDLELEPMYVFDWATYLSDTRQARITDACVAIVSRFTVQEEADARTLVLISGFIHDTSSFVANHPGGKRLLESYTGKDATDAFFGGIYRHSNAAQNVREKHRSFFFMPLLCPLPAELVLFSLPVALLWFTCDIY
jgi:hypothetical protein